MMRFNFSKDLLQCPRLWVSNTYLLAQKYRHFSNGRYYYRPPTKYFIERTDESSIPLKLSHDPRRSFRILALDGGGCRGMLTITILIRILRKYPTLLDNIDLVCGTSAGGILALLIASGKYSLDESKDIYQYAMPYIFQKETYRRWNPFVSKYSDKNKEEIMKYYFGDLTMKDLSKPCAVVAFRLDGKRSSTHSFFDTEGWRPAIFSNLPKADGRVEPDKDLFIYQAAMRTSAAPTFFPIYENYTDGGIVANNPSVIACSKAMAHFSHVSPRNITVLSLGAGTYPRSLNISTVAANDWGIGQWSSSLVDLLLDGDSVTTDMIMHYLLGQSGRYFRFDPKLPTQFALDDVEGLPKLVDFAESIDLTNVFQFIDSKFSYDDFDSIEDNNTYNSLDVASHYHDSWEQFSNAKIKPN